MAASTEARELELVNKVSLRIGLAKDSSLEKLLDTYLIPLLLKLASDHVSVRNEVINMGQHLKIRLSGNDDIKLPVEKLLQQYKSVDNSMVCHFDMMFVQASIGKLTWPEQANLLPVIVENIAVDAKEQTGPIIFNLFLRLLPRLKIPLRGSKEDQELRAKFHFDEHVIDAECIASLIEKLLLLSSVSVSSSNIGLTTDEVKFLTLSKPDTWDPKQPDGLDLQQTKVAALKFVSSGAFKDEERFLPSLIASADPDSRINSIGNELIKRSTVSVEDKAVVESLYRLYMLNRPPLRIKILQMLAKSHLATNYVEKIKSVMTTTLTFDGEQAAGRHGLESNKLRKALFSFINWVSRMASKDTLETLSPWTVKWIGEFFEDEGWPNPSSFSPDSMELRSLAYETLGTMAAAVPSTVVEPDLGLVRWLFRALAEERSPHAVFMSIEAALASILTAFTSKASGSSTDLDLPGNVDPKVLEQLRTLLLEVVTQPLDEDVIHSARFVAIRWANRCLQYDDVVARWIDVDALAPRKREKRDIAEEGRRGLDPYLYRTTNMIESTSEINLPNFYELVTTFFTLNPLIPNSHAANTLRTGMDLDSIIDSFGNFGGERLPCFSQASSFCRQVLLLGALQSPSTIGGDADWERQLSVLLRTDNESRQKIRKHLSTFLSDAPPDCDSSLPTFLNAAFDGMIWNNGEGLGDCGNSFVEIASLSPEESLDNVAPRVLELLPSIISNDIAIRSTAAQAMGILCAHSTNGQSKIEEVLSLLLSIVEGWKSAIGAELNKVHGAVLTVGFVMSRAVFYHRTRTMHSLRDQYLPRAVNLIVGIIQEGNDKSSKDAAYTAFGMLAIAGWISGQAVDNEGISKVKDALSADAKKGNEKAISALGRYAFISDDDRMSELLKVLYDLHELKQPEIHFAIGEALAVACAGWKSDSLSLAFDVDSDYEGPEGETSVLIGVLEKLLRDCKQTKPSLKKASGIWLFSLIQYCGHLPEVQSRLPQCQATFMNLLSARDDLVQETASRGLSLVYEQGDKALQERLVADLVASFTGGSTKIKVDEETELFEPGALPTGNGESVTSYKDIMNLAAEVGDQSLVYKFMSLASNAATWSTRAAFGRFGLSNILSESAVDPKVYPKLYRYRFDPNPNVQRSMNDIWSALVKSPSKTIRDNFDPIVTDLLKNILGKEWRTREASCAAIADLVQTSRFEECEKFLPQIWEVAFKVLDDIKGSVRKAAEKLCKVLTGILIRQLESGSESVHARAMLKEVMPFLFSTRGLESSSKEVQAFALMTVLKLTKKGGKLLLPYIPLVVENILGLLSTLEPDYVNYIHMNAAKYDTTADKIDAARSNAISRSPLMEAVERCLDLVDDETMRSLAPQLHRVIKSAVGMPSKMGCCGALSSLATRHQAIFKPYANDFLKLMQKAVLDRNPTVSAGYAHAAGYISRLASDEQILKIEAFSRELYFNAESETNRQVAAEIIFSISKCATDRFNALSSAFLPFVFFAKHDFDEHVKEQFTKTWDENVGGSRAVLLYLKDIINICLESLPSAKWTVKHTAALTIADVVESAGSVIDIADQKIVWPALEKALLLKTFDGKEKVLDAFVTFTKSSKAFWSEDAAVAAAMTKAAVREAKRTNESYRPHAFRALGDYAAARTDIGLFGEVYNVVKSYFDEVLDEDGDQDKMDIDEDKKTASRTTMTITAGIGALFKAAGGDTVSHLPQLRDRTKAVFKSAKADINTKTVVYEQTKQLFSTDAAKVADGSILWDFFDLLELPSGAGGELSRTKRAEAAAALLKAAENAFGDVGAKEEVVGKMRSQIAEALRHERSYTVKKVLEAVFFER